MDFKPTRFKTLISIIIGLIVGFLFGWKYTWSGWIFHLGIYIVAFLILTFLSYIIWSLFGKKK